VTWRTDFTDAIHEEVAAAVSEALRVQPIKSEGRGDRYKFFRSLSGKVLSRWDFPEDDIVQLATDLMVKERAKQIAQSDGQGRGLSATPFFCESAFNFDPESAPILTHPCRNTKWL